MKKAITLVLMALHVTASGQEKADSSSLEISGFVEVYYLYDSENPDDHDRADFIYSYDRHNEITVNLAFLKAAYASSNTRGNLALMTGTYANANLTTEPGVLKNIFEANAGVKILKNVNLWLDAGVFASHIGFESAIGKDNWNLTRSMLADNSPYYESGAKLTYISKSEKWLLSGLALNGWQHIQRPAGNNSPAFGHQITFKPGQKVTLNSSSFVGSDSPDSNRLARLFHNFYGQFQLTSSFGMILGFDIGKQQIAKDKETFSTWYSPVVILRYAFTEKIAMAVRGEYYSDEEGVIIYTGTPNGFQTTGFSFNFDYSPASNAIIRLEGRTLQSKDEIFIRGGRGSNTNYSVGASLCISF